MAIEENSEIAQENKKCYLIIEQLVQSVSENIEINNNKNELIEMMFSYIQDKHNFDKVWEKVELTRERGLYINITSEHKETYIQNLEIIIKNYVQIIKNNMNIARENYVQSIKEQNITKEELNRKLSEESLTELIKKFEIDMGVITREVKKAFNISLDNDNVQESYKTIINSNPYLLEKLRKTNPKTKKVTILEKDALEIAKRYNHSFFAYSRYRKELDKENNNLF